MKTVKCNVIAICVALLLVGGARAAENASDGREADHAALRTMMAKAVRAINSQDMDALASCFNKNFVFTTVDQSVLTSTLALKSYYDRMLRSESSPVTGLTMNPKVDIPTLFLDATTGFSCGTSDDVYTLRRDGRMVHMPSNWTALVVKVGGEWKIAAVHAGVNVMANPILDNITGSLGRNLLWAGALGILAGFGVGYLVARRKGKTPETK